MQNIRIDHHELILYHLDMLKTRELGVFIDCTNSKFMRRPFSFTKWKETGTSQPHKDSTFRDLNRYALKVNSENILVLTLCAQGLEMIFLGIREGVGKELGRLRAVNAHLKILHFKI